MIYFTSDLHFYHENIFSYCNRPSNVFDIIIQNWNSTVGEDDEIYILGDLTLKGPKVANEVLANLNGRKYLVKGNHDTFAKKSTFDAQLFEWIKDYHRFHAEYNDRKQMFVLSHFPFLVWDCQCEGSIHLHGHIHSTEQYNIDNANAGILRFDVGVDANNYTPVSLEKVMEWASVNPNAEREDYHYTKRKSKNY